jgi:hypothetical protein
MMRTKKYGILQNNEYEAKIKTLLKRPEFKLVDLNNEFEKHFNSCFLFKN